MPFQFETSAPAGLAEILSDTEAAGFQMASAERTGALLRMLAATKPGGRLLELGTGTGAATAWLLDGMDEEARLVSVESEEKFLQVARKHLGADARCELVCEDGGAFLERQAEESFDLIFADTWAGKFTHLEEALALLRVGGLYVVDDLAPQPNWPEDHPPKVEAYLRTLGSRADLTLATLDWGTGHLIAAKRR